MALGSGKKTDKQCNICGTCEASRPAFAKGTAVRVALSPFTDLFCFDRDFRGASFSEEFGTIWVGCSPFFSRTTRLKGGYPHHINGRNIMHVAYDSLSSEMCLRSGSVNRRNFEHVFEDVK